MTHLCRSSGYYGRATVPVGGSTHILLKTNSCLSKPELNIHNPRLHLNEQGLAGRTISPLGTAKRFPSLLAAAEPAVIRT